MVIDSAPARRSPALVRPERLRIVGVDDAGPAAAGANTVEASVRDALYLGSTRKYELTLPDGQAATVRQQVVGGEQVWQPGDRVGLTWAVDDAVLVSDPAG